MTAQSGFRRLMANAQAAWTLILGVILAITTVILFVLWIYKPATLVVAVDPTSDDAALLQGFADQLAADRAPVRLSVRRLPDAAAVREALDRGETQLAVVRADLGIPVEGRAVATLRDNVLAILVPNGSKIGSPAELEGRRVAMVGSDVSTAQVGAVLTQYGKSATALTAIPLTIDRLAAAMQAGEIDAVAVAGPAVGTTIAEVVKALSAAGKPPSFVPIALAEALAQRLPIYEATEIPAGTFGGNPPLPDENVTTVSFAHHLLARTSVNEQTVAELARQLFEGRPRLAQRFPAISLLSAPSTAKDADVLPHPGAAAYFDDGEQSFFDRYGDWVYISAMVASLVGSLAAGLANFVGGAKLRRRATARRLGRLLKRCATAESVAVLDEIEADADAIVAQAMVRIERGNLPPDALSSFSLSLDLVRRAAAERRVALLVDQRPARATGPAAAPKPARAVPTRAPAPSKRVRRPRSR